MNRFIMLAGLLFAQFSWATDQAIVDRYNRSCIACHSSGAAGAPIAFNVEAWAPRLEKGMDVLLQSTINGLNAMPPKGVCFDCSEEDFKALIVYMSSAKD